MQPSQRSSWLGGSDSRLAGGYPHEDLGFPHTSAHSSTSNESKEDAGIDVQVSNASLNQVSPNEHVNYSNEADSLVGTDRASADDDRSTLHDFEVVDADDEKEKEKDISRTDIYGFIDSDRPLPTPKSQVDVRVLREREKKWLTMLEDWRHFMDEEYKKVRGRCRKGIPPALRGRAWLYLCGAAYQMDVSKNKDVFAKCVAQPGDPKFVEEIRKDLSRQFPDHIQFSRSGPYGENGKEDLFELLKAWTVLHPEEGYCQGQAPIAAVLLMHMPLKDAFYCFVQICHKYLPGYYSAGLEAVQIDGDILNQLLKEKAPKSYRHLKKNNVDPVLYMIEWFMCVFCRTLPWPTVLRVWDMFFCEGVKVLFKVAIVLFQHGLGTQTQLKQYPDLHSIVTRLRNLPPEILTEEALIPRVIALNLDDQIMERTHYRAMKVRQMKVKGGLS